MNWKAGNASTGNNMVNANLHIGLFAASLSVFRMETFGFSIGFCHVFTFFCLAVVLVTFAMIDLA